MSKLLITEKDMNGGKNTRVLEYFAAKGLKAGDTWDTVEYMEWADRHWKENYLSGHWKLEE